MQQTPWALFRIPALLLYLTLVGCQSKPESTPIQPSTPTHNGSPTRVLFIGNSFTFWKGGLWKHINALSAAMEPPLKYQAESVTRGGASLEVMWHRTKAQSVIAEGRWDVVVLQGDIPETTIDSFKQYSRRFVEAVRKVGARPILFMAWDYDRLNWLSMNEIATAHATMSKELDVEVAPVGLAWKESAKRNPTLDMYARDREHPSAAGMYLSLLTIEGVISNADPTTRLPHKLGIRGLEKIHTRDKEHLRKVAAWAIKNWASRRP